MDLSIAPQRHALPHDLLAEVAGRVVLPDDAKYDESRATYYPGFDRRPAAIVQAADAGDVARVVSLASEKGLDLAIRSGGHSIAGHSALDGGLVLDLANLRSLRVDVAGRTAWVGPGMTTGEYTTTVARYGLATGFGDAGSVGIGGITLGGGIGFLVRKHGLTIDHLLAAEVVTADGALRYTDAEHQPDLFWALRGGGGNFGVVTRMRFRLQPVDRIVAGALVLPATPEVVRSFVEAADAAPRDLSTIANVMSAAPPVPFVPERHHGQPVVIALMVHAGPPEDARRDLEVFRSLTEPIADTLAPMRYADLYPPEEDEPIPLAGFAVDSGFVDTIGADDADAIVEGITDATAPMAVVQFRVLGGALAAVPADETAYGHRDRRILVNVAAGYARPEDASQQQRWTAGLARRLFRGDQAAYINFVGAAGPDRVRAAYPEATWDRLQQIKRRYDPGNLFRHNHNIPPAGMEHTASI